MKSLKSILVAALISSAPSAFAAAESYTSFDAYPGAGGSSGTVEVAPTTFVAKVKSHSNYLRLQDLLKTILEHKDHFVRYIFPSRELRAQINDYLNTDRPAQFASLAARFPAALPSPLSLDPYTLSFEERFATHFLHRYVAGHITPAPPIDHTYTFTLDGQTYTLEACPCSRISFYSRIVLTLYHINALLQHFPPESTPELVHTSFGAGNLLQLYMLALGLTMVGYKKIVFNVIDPDIKPDLITLFNAPTFHLLLANLADVLKSDSLTTGSSSEQRANTFDMQPAYATADLDPSLNVHLTLNGFRSAAEYRDTSRRDDWIQPHSYDAIDASNPTPEETVWAQEQFMDLINHAQRPNPIIYGSGWKLEFEWKDLILVYQRQEKLNLVEQLCSRLGDGFESKVILQEVNRDDARFKTFIALGKNPTDKQIYDHFARIRRNNPNLDKLYMSALHPHGFPLEAAGDSTDSYGEAWKKMASRFHSRMLTDGSENNAENWLAVLTIATDIKNKFMVPAGEELFSEAYFDAREAQAHVVYASDAIIRDALTILLDPQVVYSSMHQKKGIEWTSFSLLPNKVLEARDIDAFVDMIQRSRTRHPLIYIRDGKKIYRLERRKDF